MTPTAPTGQLESLRGIRLYFETCGSGEPLLLLHGFTGSSMDWAELAREWSSHFQIIAPDLRGHGRSENPADTFRHTDAADDILALLDHLGIEKTKGLGVSAGANVLLHMATKQPSRVAAMVLVSGTPYFPQQARRIMREYTVNSQTEQERELLSRRHPGGEAQIEKLMANVRAFAESYDDMNFTPPSLSRIDARTLIVQGDRDPLYPVELSVEMARAIPKSTLWIVPGGSHGPIFAERRPEFVRTAAKFLGES
jgi:pimeloyl-ACP methyl ester carboxylesterase